MKTIGARICVDAYEIIGEVEETALDNTVRVEEDFFIKLRRVRMEDSDLFELSCPRSLTDYIELEEAVRDFVASLGGPGRMRAALAALARRGGQFTPRLVKVGGLERGAVEEALEEVQDVPGLAAVMADHDYCSLPAIAGGGAGRAGACRRHGRPRLLQPPR